MRGRMSTRLQTEGALASVSAVLLVLTLAWPDWIEALTGLDPDHHDGAVEWAIVAVLLVTTVTLGVAARSEWLRTAGEER
ncbi:MAG: transporter permease [Conexibacter sp.]|nr:transporter permease [Conexibacter sp.]